MRLRLAVLRCLIIPETLAIYISWAKEVCEISTNINKEKVKAQFAIEEKESSFENPPVRQLRNSTALILLEQL